MTPTPSSTSSLPEHRIVSDALARENIAAHTLDVRMVQFSSPLVNGSLYEMVTVRLDELSRTYASTAEDHWSEAMERDLVADILRQRVTDTATPKPKPKVSRAAVSRRTRHRSRLLVDHPRDCEEDARILQVIGGLGPPKAKSIAAKFGIRNPAGALYREIDLYDQFDALVLAARLNAAGYKADCGVGSPRHEKVFCRILPSAQW